MNRYTLYWWRTCSQCRDAKNALEAAGVTLELRDFFAEPFTRAELESLAQRVSIDDLFSWRSPSSVPFRARRYSMRQSELIDEMLKQPRLIRRPILETPDGDVIVGYRAGAPLQPGLG